MCQLVGADDPDNVHRFKLAVTIASRIPAPSYPGRIPRKGHRLMIPSAMSQYALVKELRAGLEQSRTRHLDELAKLREELYEPFLAEHPDMRDSYERYVKAEESIKRLNEHADGLGLFDPARRELGRQIREEQLVLKATKDAYETAAQQFDAYVKKRLRWKRSERRGFFSTYY